MLQQTPDEQNPLTQVEAKVQAAPFTLRIAVHLPETHC
jgi:hypothetical protein